MSATVSAEDAAGVIAEVMGQIRSDVEAGLAGNIEADAVLCGVFDGLAAKFSEADPGFNKAAFSTACDLDELIPSEAFDQSW